MPVSQPQVPVFERKVTNGSKRRHFSRLWWAEPDHCLWAQPLATHSNLSGLFYRWRPDRIRSRWHPNVEPNLQHPRGVRLVLSVRGLLPVRPHLQPRLLLRQLAPPWLDPSRSERVQLPLQRWQHPDLWWKLAHGLLPLGLVQVLRVAPCFVRSRQRGVRARDSWPHWAQALGPGLHCYAGEEQGPRSPSFGLKGLRRWFAGMCPLIW